PGWLSWSALALPVWLRWSGAGLGLAAAGLHWGSHHALGHNFAPFLHVREQHTLVSSGVYRWVRHPLYTALFITGLTCFLLAANWFIGLVWAGFALAVACQVKTEEAMMVEKFGEQYRRYQQSTGQFLPRFDSFK
ncbi:MAG: isoprenylcysteine carboxylmethyltransferase family protein, partial [Chloroflexota bacterium]